jgi:hypothetical protein
MQLQEQLHRARIESNSTMMTLSWWLVTILSTIFVCVQAAKRSSGQADVAVHNNRLRSKTLSSLTREL